ncbi:MAG: methyltransferase domain-containing protein [Gemmatimonadota bacterium]
MSREDADVASSSDRYAERFAGEVGAWFLEIQSELTLELLAGMPAGGRVVDVGGGHGQLVRPLHAAGFDLTVVGSAPICGARVADDVGQGRCRFDVADLYDLPYPDRAFDVALSFRLLAHVEDPARLVSELCRVARRAVIVDYPSLRSVNLMAGLLYGLKSGVETNTRRFRVFRPASVRALFEGEGFAVVGSRGQFALPMALHRALRSATLARALEAPLRATRLTAAFGSPVIVRADRVLAGARG